MSSLMELLRRQPCCEGFQEEEILRMAKHLTPIDLPAGEKIYRRGEPIQRVYLLVTGRVRLTAPTHDQQEPVVVDSSPGEFLGAYALIESECSFGDMEVIDPAHLLAMDREDFLAVLDDIPRLGFNMLRRLTRRTKQLVGLERPEVLARTVGVLWKGLRGRRLLKVLALELSQKGERVAAADGREPQQGEKWAQLLRAHDRVFVEVDLDQASQDSLSRVARCDQLLWLVDRESEPALRQVLTRLLEETPEAAERLEVVWMLPERSMVAPPWDRAWNLKRRHSMIELPEEPGRITRLGRQGLDRLVRRLRGVTLGLTLAGGGARGMAHLGAFRAFERAGIGFDVMSGTSCGAMVGITYAAGYTPDFAIAAYKRDLTPTRLFRLIPKGANWHIIWKFRTRAWERMLRRHFHDWSLERLPIPFRAVTVDLVRGCQVVHRSGDAVRAILESINLPVISPPIIHDGMALVDGGVLNNLPADVLAEEGADLVVGVDVSSKLRDEFGGNSPGTPTDRMKRAGSLETLIRVLETQGRGLGALRARSVDLSIEPDASAFSFVDFTKAPELAEAGEAAAESAIPRLKELIAEVEERVSAKRPVALASKG